jgi:hypothetical protein
MRALTELTALTLGTGTLPGGAGEAIDYAMREAESPEAQEFVGGHGEVLFIILIVGVFILAYMMLKKENAI